MSTTDGADDVDAPGPGADPHRWTALVILLVAAFMDLLDVSIINVAVPSIQLGLGATYADVQWTTAGYTLAFALLLITGGRLGDIVGRKVLFQIGMTLFVVASLGCGLAPTASVLITARIAQGISAALMVPQVLSTIAVSFTESERGKVVGLYGAVAGLALVSGPVLGGVLVSADLFGLGWRTVFLVNVPVGVVCLVLAGRYVSGSRAPQRTRLDLVGVALAIGGLFLLVFPLVQGRELGWPPWAILMLVAAVPVLALFIAHQVRANRHSEWPLVPLGPFRARSYAVGLVAILLLQAVPAAFALIWTLHVQVGLGWSPLRAGLTTVPTSLAAAAVGAVSMQMIVPRFGRAALLLGPILIGAGVALSAVIVAEQTSSLSSWAMVGPFALIGIGLGLLIAPLTSLVLVEVEPSDAGSASGLINTTQQLGAAVGIALIGLAFFGLISGSGAGAVDEARLRSQLATAGITEPAQSAAVSTIRLCVTEQLAEQDPTRVPAICGPLEAASTPPAVRAATVDTVADTRATGFARSFAATSWYLGAGLLAAFALILLLPRHLGRPPASRVPDSAAEPAAASGS